MTYYALIVRYHRHEHTWMEIFSGYQSMWDTPSLMSDADAKSTNLKRQCIYLMLSPFDKERTQQLHILNGIKHLETLPMFKELVRLFTTQEIFHYNELKASARGTQASARHATRGMHASARHARAPVAHAPGRARSHRHRHALPSLSLAPSLPLPLSLFLRPARVSLSPSLTLSLFRRLSSLQESLKNELSSYADFDAKEVELMLTTFHARVTEHNLGVVSAYYGRITLERLASLLELELGKMEEQLCDMVSKKQIYARIDRPSGVVTFQAPKSPNELLNDWAGDIGSLLNMLEGTCHLIHKENMVHKIA